MTKDEMIARYIELNNKRELLTKEITDLEIRIKTCNSDCSSIGNDILPEMITIREASRRTGVSYDRLRNMCLSGELAHFNTGKKFLINVEHLAGILRGNV